MDKTLDTYLSLCTEVYDLSKPNPPEDAYAFYRDYAMRANGPILELMCGTGRFYYHYLQRDSMYMALMQAAICLKSCMLKPKLKILTLRYGKALLKI